MTDTFDGTFALFFGPSEDEVEGTVRREDENGIISAVVIDQDAHDKAQKAAHEEADRRNAEQDALYELMDQLNN